MRENVKKYGRRRKISKVHLTEVLQGKERQDEGDTSYS